jgi:MSHA biogenesis protein MshL
VNYPNSQRTGNSETRVSSGGGQSSSSGSSSAAGATGGSTGGSSQPESSKVSTSSKTDYWTELSGAVKGMLGSGEGRSVITSPQSGIMAVRAMPEELRQVEQFLKAAQIAVERQVMLEAKVIEVELRDGYQSGVNWAAFNTQDGVTAGIGVLGAATTSTNPLLPIGSNVISGAVPIPSAAAGGGLFGLALGTSQFASVLGFLETQGDVQTLSSPRVATLNNQKAVLKVGSDEFYVTNVSGGTSTAATGTTAATSSMPTVSLQQFFSGISLDVTPQVDGGNMVMLHVHPSLTTVTEKTKQIDLGSVGNYRLPLASSSVNETDTLVRIQDGAIVAIGGLMQMESSRTSSGLPGTMNTPFFGALLGNKAVSGRKKEVIVLIKPTIIRSATDWEALNKRTRDTINEMDTTRARLIKLDGGTPEDTAK